MALLFPKSAFQQKFLFRKQFELNLHKLTLINNSGALKIKKSFSNDDFCFHKGLSHL